MRQLMIAHGDKLARGAYFGSKKDKAALRQLVKLGLARIVREDKGGPEGVELYACPTPAAVKGYDIGRYEVKAKASSSSSRSKAKGIDMAPRVADALNLLPASLRLWGERFAGRDAKLLETVPRMLGLYRKMQTALPVHIRRLQESDRATNRLTVMLPWAHSQWDSATVTRSEVTTAFDAVVSDLIDAGEVRRVYVAGHEYLTDPDVTARAAKKAGQPSGVKFKGNPKPRAKRVPGKTVAPRVWGAALTAKGLLAAMSATGLIGRHELAGKLDAEGFRVTDAGLDRTLALLEKQGKITREQQTMGAGRSPMFRKAAKRKRTPAGGPENTVLGDELKLYIDTSSEPTYQMIEGTAKQLVNRQAADTYDRTKALKAFVNVANFAAKEYTRDVRKPGPHGSFGQFSPTTRAYVARHLLSDYEARAKWGEYNRLLAKKYRKSAPKPGLRSADAESRLAKARADLDAGRITADKFESIAVKAHAELAAKR